MNGTASIGLPERQWLVVMADCSPSCTPEVRIQMFHVGAADLDVESRDTPRRWFYVIET